MGERRKVRDNINFRSLRIGVTLKKKKNLTLNWVPWSAKSECGHLVNLEISECSEEHYFGVAFYWKLVMKRICGGVSHLVQQILWFLFIKSSKQKNQNQSVNTHYDT